MKHTSPISGIASYKDRYIATAGYDNNLILWNPNNNHALNLSKHDHLVNQCDFSSNGKFLVSASSDHSARVWKLPSMQLYSLLSGHIDDVEMAKFSDDGQYIATAGRDHLVKVFTVDGKEIRSFKGHTADVISVVWDNDSKKIYSSSDDGTIRIWDLKNGECEKVLDLGDTETDTLVIFNDGVIVAGNDDGELVSINGDQIKKIKCFKSGIKRIISHSEKNYLLALSYDRTMKLFRKLGDNSLELILKDDIPDLIWPRSAAFIENNKIAFATFGDRYAIYCMQTNKWNTIGIGPTQGLNAIKNIKGNLYTIGDAGILKSNKLIINKIGTLCNFICSIDEIIITGGQSGIVYNALSGEEIYKYIGPLNCATSYENEGIQYIIIGTYTGEALIFKKVEGLIKFIKKVEVLQNAIKGISSNHNYIFAVGAAGDAIVINQKSLEKIHYEENCHSQIANGCDFLRENKFVSVSRDKTLRIFNITEDKVSIEGISTPHKRSIKCVATDNLGEFVATGSYFGILCIYNMKTKKWIRNIKLTNSGLSSLIFDKEKQAFIASSYDGNTYEEGIHYES